MGNLHICVFNFVHLKPKYSIGRYRWHILRCFAWRQEDASSLTSHTRWRSYRTSGAVATLYWCSGKTVGITGYKLLEFSNLIPTLGEICRLFSCISSVLCCAIISTIRSNKQRLLPYKFLCTRTSYLPVRRLQRCLQPTLEKLSLNHEMSPSTHFFNKL